jgi:hypothetical protein
MLIFAAAAAVLLLLFFFYFRGVGFVSNFKRRKAKSLSVCVRVRSASFMSHHCLFDQCQAKVLTIFLSFT